MPTIPTYAAPPGPRIPYDLNGAAFMAGSANPSSVAVFNANVYNATGWGPKVGLLLPQPHDIYGIFLSRDAASNVYTSTDTTNGVDGTWVDAGYTGYSGWDDAYRSAIFTPGSPITGVVGIIVGKTGTPGLAHNLHLYGFRSSGASVDCLRIWNPTTDVRLANVIDFGTTTPASVYTGSFRVKNTSATLAASGITLAFNINGDTSPTLAGQAAMSKDGGTTWSTTTLTLSDLAAGAISPVISVRYSPPGNAQIGLNAQRIIAAATGWA